MKAFTLIEVLISACLLIIIVSGLFTVLTLGDKVWSVDMALVVMQQQVRHLMQGVVRELRQSKPSEIEISSAGQKVVFAIPESTSDISYYLQDGNLVREHPAGAINIIAGNVDNLQFCCSHGSVCDEECASSRLLKINLESGKEIRGRNLSFTLKEQVRLRNE